MCRSDCGTSEYIYKHVHCTIGTRSCYVTYAANLISDEGLKLIRELTSTYACSKVPNK